jgi:uncharacterized damage-inducible protein DinB
MPDFTKQDMTGSRFEEVDLSGARFHNLMMRDVRITGAWMVDLVLDGEIEGSLTVNGVDLLPVLETELNKRFPGREAVYAVRTSGADAFRAAWAVVEEAWVRTVERLQALPPELVHERVDGQWSAVENLRHLVMAIDSWAKRTLLGDPAPYHPMGLPFDEMGEVEGVPNDPDARPSLDEVLAVHADRKEVVRALIDGLTDERLEETTEPNTAPGYPEPRAYPVRRCLAACVIEEWEHRRFIDRDLEVLESR